MKSYPLTWSVCNRIARQSSKALPEVLLNEVNKLMFMFFNDDDDGGGDVDYGDVWVGGKRKVHASILAQILHFSYCQNRKF